MTDLLPQLLKRLETVTVRLEELASKPGAVTAAGAAADNGKSQSQANESSSPALQAFQELVDGPLASFVSLSTTVGGLVAEQAGFFKAAFDAQQQLLVTASKSKKPSPDALQVCHITQWLQHRSPFNSDIFNPVFAQPDIG